MKRKGLIAVALVLLAFGILAYLLTPKKPEVHASFPESLSQAQRTEIPILIRKETRRRIFAFLKSCQWKAAWTELHSARNQRIIAIGYQPADTNKVWVYITRTPKPDPRPPVSIIYPMTNTQGHWKITD